MFQKAGRLLASLLACQAILLSVNAAEAASPAEAVVSTGDQFTVNQKVGITDQEIVIGSCAPLTGQMKARGVPVVMGGKAYFDYINDQGGINGRKIKLISCDDHYNVNEGAINCFNNCLKGKVFLGALFQGTASAAKYVPLSEAHHIPMVGFSTGGEFIVKPVHPYAYQLRASYSDEAAEQVDVLLHKLQLHRIALIYQDDAYGAACRHGVMQAMKRNGADLIAEVGYPRLTTDVEPVIAQVKTSRPEAVIIGGAGDAVSMLVKRKGDIGAHVLMVSFSSSTDLLTEEAGKAADGTLVSQVLPMAYKDLATVELYKKLSQKYVHEAPTLSGFEGFLIGMSVVEGLKRAGKDLTRDNFVKAMDSIHNFDIGLGSNFKLNFSPTQHDGLQGKVYMTQIKKGQIELVPDWNKFKASI
jgi:ABC-type branched-subunit amino acid transport system substrate-binding protein